ncbi:GTPase [Undibacterium sp. SXout20W]|uniref:GTPase n=1 Tax=Undibacterium sp. SXout20W TaxID=3413051 RepID=UPI003BF36CB5
MSDRIPLTIVSGADYALREATIAEASAAFLSAHSQDAKIAAILEGLPAGNLLLQASTQLNVQRIAPGCFCCIGNLTMRVTLNRLLRQKIQHLYLSVASTEHLQNIRQTLQQAPYDQLLLEDSLICL